MKTAYVAERSAQGRVPKGIRAAGVRTIRDLFDKLFA